MDPLARLNLSGDESPLEIMLIESFINSIHEYNSYLSMMNQNSHEALVAQYKLEESLRWAVKAVKKNREEETWRQIERP